MKIPSPNSAPTIPKIKIDRRAPFAPWLCALENKLPDLADPISECMSDALLPLRTPWDLNPSIHRIIDASILIATPTTAPMPVYLSASIITISIYLGFIYFNSYLIISDILK